MTDQDQSSEEASPESVEEADFAQAILRALQVFGDSRTWIYDAEQSRIVVEEEEESKQAGLFLGNVWHEHQGMEPDQRRQHIANLATALMETPGALPTDWETVRPHIRPKIWPRLTFATMEMRADLLGEKSPDIPLYPLGSHLYLSVVFDTEHTIQSVSQDDLEGWGLTIYEALEIAKENLIDSTEEWLANEEGLMMASTRDHYDSARILLLGHVEPVEDVEQHLVIVPSRDTLLVADPEQPAALVAAADIIQEDLQKSTRLLCPLPIRKVDGEWIDWTPPTESPAHSVFHELTRTFYAELYGGQKQALDELPEDIVGSFVASYSLIRRDDDAPMESYCVWADGVDTLLPKTDLVAFGIPDRAPILVPWDSAESVVGSLMSPIPDLYPARFRVEEFPSNNQLRQLVAHSVK